MRMMTAEETERAMLDATREIVEGMYRIGHLSDEKAQAYVERRAEAGAKPLRLVRAAVEEAALTPVGALTPDAVRELRERERASQAAFARHLGVAVRTVRDWERGVRKPDGAAAKLLALAQAHGLAYIR